LGLNAVIPSSPAGSKLLLWNEVTQAGYTTYTRVGTPSGWLPSVPSLTAGSAFFVSSAQTTNVTWNVNFNPQ